MYSFLLFVSWIFIFTRPANCCIAQEAQLLLNLKENLGFQEWFPDAFASWRNDTDCCSSWKGVVCNPLTSHVEELHLSDSLSLNNTQLLLYPLSQLPRLTYLDLGENNLSVSAVISGLARFPALSHIDLDYLYAPGSGDPEIDFSEWKVESLERLRYFDISENYIMGRVPDQLSNMTNLLYLDLSGNGFTSNFKAVENILSNMTNLLHLDLSVNSFTSNFKAAESILSRMMNLQHLGLADINLGTTTQHFFDKIVANMSSLVTLDLSDTSLTQWNVGPQMKWLRMLSSLQELRMDFNSIEANIPLALANLTEMRTLDLSHNNFSGEIPDCLGRMHQLQILNLGGNELNGTIPNSLGNMSHLRVLGMGGNYLSGGFPEFISKLSYLEILDISNNQLTGSIPPSFHLPPLVQALDIGSNNMNGTIYETFFLRSNNIEEIVMSNSGLSINFSSIWIPPFNNAHWIALSSCKMRGNFPSWISTQVSISILDLSNNDLQGPLPSSLWEVLEDELSIFLNLSRNQFDGDLSYFGNFEIVDLSFNKFTSLSPTSRGLFKNQKINELLFINNNNIEGPLPMSICTNKSSIYLDASNNKFSSDIPSALGDCSHLEMLNLENNHFQGRLPSDFGKNLTSLTFLSLENNELTGSLPNSLASCTQLQVLKLGNNNFEGMFPTWISQLHQLGIMKINSNKLKGSIPYEIGRMAKLHFLDLSFNHLSGEIPPSLWRLIAFQSEIHDLSGENISLSALERHVTSQSSQYVSLDFNSKGTYLKYDVVLMALMCIDLSHNNFSGSIPTQIEMLKGLKQLNLSHNFFSGPIPKSIIKLEQMESLDLSHNNFKGKIPQGFTYLSSLEYLNLSYNNLSGVVPRGGQMLTFNTSSFEGNKELKDPLKSIPKHVHEQISQETDDITSKWYKMEEMLWRLVVGISFGVGFLGFILAMKLSATFCKKALNFMDHIIQAWIFKY